MNVQTQRSGYVMISDDDSDEDADAAWDDAREVVVDEEVDEEHVSVEEVLGTVLAGIGVPDTNAAAVAAKEGAEAAMVDKEQVMRRSWFRAERRVII